MSTELYSTSFVPPFEVPGRFQPLQGYYRSKLFTHSSTTNPLVSAAGPLLSLLERLSVSPTLPPILNIRDNIEHELHAFESQLSGQQYAEEFIVIAGYLLRATIDEFIGKNYLRLLGFSPEFRSFTPLTHDNIGPERRFFDVVNHIKQRANQYLNLLELAYYCLILGFEGEEHMRPNGRQTLDNLTEELYQLIQHNRANKPHRLFKTHAPMLSSLEAVSYKQVIIASVVALVAVSAIYFGSHLLLEHKAETLMQGNTLFANWNQ